MAHNYNKVILVGRLTRDPELRELPNGNAALNAGLATSRSWVDRDSGEKREEVCFVDLSAFGRTAELIREYFTKGKPILIEGRLQLRSWETPEGEKRSKHDVFVERFEFVSTKDEDFSGSRSGGTSSHDSMDDDIPF